MYSCGPPLMDVQEWDDQHELTYSSYVRTRVVILKTCRRRWMIGRNGERRSGISAQAARHDDDDEISVVCLHTDKWSNNSISNNSILHKSFVCTQFKTLLCGSNGNEEVLLIPKSSIITGASPSDYLMSYPGHSLVGGLVEMQPVYSRGPADWAVLDWLPSQVTYYFPTIVGGGM